MQRRRKTKNGEQELEGPDREAKRGYHDGREDDWNPPTTPEVEGYLVATARDLFGEKMPAERTLTFNAKTAAERSA